MANPHAVEADRLLSLVTKEASSDRLHPQDAIRLGILALCAIGRAILANGAD